MNNKTKPPVKHFISGRQLDRQTDIRQTVRRTDAQNNETDAGQITERHRPFHASRTSAVHICVSGPDRPAPPRPAWPDPTRPELARSGLLAARLGSAQLGSSQLFAAQLGSAVVLHGVVLHGFAQLGSSQLSSAQLWCFAVPLWCFTVSPPPGPARPGPAQPALTLKRFFKK